MSPSLLVLMQWLKAYFLVTYISYLFIVINLYTHKHTELCTELALKQDQQWLCHIKMKFMHELNCKL